MSLPPLSRKTFRIRLDEMLTVLRGEIVTGKRQAGEFLPSERDLVQQFQLSNKLVRVALEQLVSEGLIEKIPRIGNRVTQPSDEHPVFIRFGYHTSLDNEADMASLLEQFHRRHPKIIVQPIPLTYHNYYDTVREYIDSGMIDVVSMNYTNFQHFQSNGSLNVFQEYEADPRLYPFLSDVFVHEGKPFVRPFIFSPLVLCYNRNHLRDSGMKEPFLPANWDELHQASTKLAVENERFGLYFFLLSQNRWPVFLLQSGVYLHPDRSNITECAERIMEGLKVCRGILYADNAFPVFLAESEAVAEELFLEGKISMIMTSYFALSRLRDSGIRYDLAPLPRIRQDRTLLLAIGLAISKKSKVKVAAQTLVDFLLSDEAQGHIRKHCLSIPCVQSAAESDGEETFYRPPHFGLYRDIAGTCRLVSDMNLTPGELDAILKEARLFWAKLNNEQETQKRIIRILRQTSDPNLCR